ELITPVFKSVKNGFAVLFKGMCTFEILFPFINELYSKRRRQSHASFRDWVSHVLLVRSMLTHIKKLQLTDPTHNFDILYFYWGLRWSQVIPFLPVNLASKIVCRFHGSDLYEHLNRDYIPFREKQLKRLTLAI